MSGEYAAASEKFAVARYMGVRIVIVAKEAMIDRDVFLDISNVSCPCAECNTLPQACRP